MVLKDSLGSLTTIKNGKQEIIVESYRRSMQEERYTAINKSEIMPFAATWMDLEIITLSEVSQTEEDRYYMISLIRGSENTTQINTSMKQN